MQAYEQLEQEWAKYNDLDPAQMVVCSSGTGALHLALEGLKLSPGSGVIVSDYTMIAVPRAVSLAGLTPVLVDCNDRLLLDDDAWRGKIAGNTRAVMFVHVYGRRCMFPKEWDQYAATLGIVEDLAECHGIHPHPLTDAACWSFYKNKIVAGEEGGAVWFRDQKCAELARSLRSLGFTADHDFRHVPRGCNYRLSNANARLIIDSLRCIRENLATRRRTEAEYDAACPTAWRMPPRDAPWVYDVRVPGLRRTQQMQVVRDLNAAGVAARMGFSPVSLQEEYRRENKYTAAGPEVLRAMDEVFYLPLMPAPPLPSREVIALCWQSLADAGYCPPTH